MRVVTLRIVKLVFDDLFLNVVEVRSWTFGLVPFTCTLCLSHTLSPLSTFKSVQRRKSDAESAAERKDLAASSLVRNDRFELDRYFLCASLSIGFRHNLEIPASIPQGRMTRAFTGCVDAHRDAETSVKTMFGYLCHLAVS